MTEKKSYSVAVYNQKHDKNLHFLPHSRPLHRSCQAWQTNAVFELELCRAKQGNSGSLKPHENGSVQEMDNALDAALEHHWLSPGVLFHPVPFVGF